MLLPVTEAYGIVPVAEFSLHNVERVSVMPLSRTTLERQLQAANADLATFAKSLQEKGLTEAQYKRNTKWRLLNANIRTVRRRLAAVAGVEANNAAVEQHKSEKAAAVAQ